MNEYSPIVQFQQRKNDNLRIEGGGGDNVPSWFLNGDALTKRVRSLSADLSAIKKEMEGRSQNKHFTPYVCLARMNERATAKSWRDGASKLFAVNRQPLIGLVGTRELMVMLDDVKAVDEVLRRLKEPNTISDYVAKVSMIESLRGFSAHVNVEDSETILKVRLIDYQDYNLNAAVEKRFESSLAENDLSYRKTFYTKTMPIYAIRVTCAKAIRDVFAQNGMMEMMYSMEGMPRYSAVLDASSSNGENFLPVAEEGVVYPVLGVLDSGVAPNAKMESWIDDVAKTKVEPDCQDRMHGSLVASVAVHGDVLAGKKWVGHHGLKIVDAPILTSSQYGDVYEDELVENIHKAIESHPAVHVWNLSVSIGSTVADDSFSTFAMALDTMQDEFNVLICKSTGNTKSFLFGRVPERICHGADSVRALTVGSIAHAKGPNDYAEIDNPSPFSRIGPGPEFIIKPEVVHYGGNAGKDAQDHEVLTGVKAIDSEGAICSISGTSFSTPRVASLAAELDHRLGGDFNPLLIKGMIVHKALYPMGVRVPEKDRARVMGFGVPPSADEILMGSPHEITLMLQDLLAGGSKIDIMDFPMPKSLIRDGFYTGQIVLTLVFDPILKGSEGAEYCQSNIEVKFGSYLEKISRDTTRRTILNPVGRSAAENLLLPANYVKVKRSSEGCDKFGLQERLQIQFQDKYYPVKKYAIDLEQLKPSIRRDNTHKDVSWFLFLQGLFRQSTESQYEVLDRPPMQPFVCLVTIRDPRKEAPVYDETMQLLEHNHFWHQPVSLRNVVRVTSQS